MSRTFYETPDKPVRGFFFKKGDPIAWTSFYFENRNFWFVPFQPRLFGDETLASVNHSQLLLTNKILSHSVDRFACHLEASCT